MSLSATWMIVIGVGCVVGLVPLAGIIGLIHCERVRTDFPEVYFQISDAESLTLSRSMIAMLIINLLAIITAAPVWFGFKWFVIANGVLFFISGLAIVICEALRLKENSDSGCQKLGQNAVENLVASFTNDIYAESYYDVLTLTYLTSTQGAKNLTDATKKWVYDKCKSERFLLTVFYGMSMVLYGPLIVVPAVLCLGMFCGGRRRYRR